MDQILATMITLTTYGTWLRGDQRGWVDDGKTLPPDPELEAADRGRLKHRPFLFQPAQFLRAGTCIGESLQQRMNLSLLALTVQTWHCHVVIGPTPYSLPDVVKCAKDAVRYGLRPGPARSGLPDTTSGSVLIGRRFVQGSNMSSNTISGKGCGRGLGVSSSTLV